MIVAKKLSKNFGSIRALDNLNFCLKKGDVVALLGPTGQGRQLFCGCLPAIFCPRKAMLKFTDMIRVFSELKRCLK